MTKMRNYLILLLFFTGLTQAVAQEPFERLYRTLDERSMYQVATTQHGSAFYTLATVFIPDSSENDRINVTKYDAKGTPDWSYDYQLTSDGTYESGDIEVMENGDFIIAYSVDLDGSGQTPQRIITYCNGATGRPQWSRSSFDTSLQAGGYGYRVMEGVRKVDESSFLYGGSESLTASSPTTDFIHLSYLDALGNAIWANVYTVNVPSSTALLMADFKVTADTGIIVCGTIDSNLSSDGQLHLYLAKLDRRGEVEWSKMYKGNTMALQSLAGMSVDQTTDQGYALSGTQTLNNRKLGFFLKTDSLGAFQYAWNAIDNQVGNSQMLFTEVLSSGSTHYVQGLYSPDGASQHTVVAGFMDSTLLWATLLKDTSAYMQNAHLIDLPRKSFGYSEDSGNLFSAHGSFVDPDTDLGELYLAQLNNDGMTLCQQDFNLIIETIDSIDISVSDLSWSSTEDLSSTIFEMDTVVRYSGLNYPPKRFLTIPPAFCQGESIDFTFQSQLMVDSVNYEWFDGSTADTFRATNVGSYPVMATIFDDYCYALCDTGIINLTGPPMPSISGSNTYCQAGFEVLTADVGNAESFFWTPGGQTTPTITVDVPGTYTITATNRCGTETATYTIQETLPDAFIQPSGNICVNGEATLRVVGSNFNQVLWETGETTTQITVTNDDLYEVTVSNFCGSITLEGSAATILPTIADISIVGGDICTGDTVDLVAVVYSYNQLTWVGYPDTGNVLRGLSLDNGEVTLIASNDCGDVEETVNLTTPPSIVISQLDFSDSLVCQQGFVQFVADVANTVNFSWSNGAPDNSDTIQVPLSQLPLTVEAVAYNLCDSASSNPISVDANSFMCTCVEVPNIFAPETNGTDNERNLFRVNVQCDNLENYRLQIFSRWGEVVFESNDPQMGIWDGSYEGQPLPMDVYVWVISYTEDGANITDSGDVTLLR